MPMSIYDVETLFRIGLWVLFGLVLSAITLPFLLLLYCLAKPALDRLPYADVFKAAFIAVLLMPVGPQPGWGPLPPMLAFAHFWTSCIGALEIGFDSFFADLARPFVYTWQVPSIGFLIIFGIAWKQLRRG